MSLLLNEIKSSVSLFKNAGKKIFCAGILMLAGFFACAETFYIFSSTPQGYYGPYSGSASTVTDVVADSDTTDTGKWPELTNAEANTLIIGWGNTIPADVTVIVLSGTTFILNNNQGIYGTLYNLGTTSLYNPITNYNVIENYGTLTINNGLTNDTGAVINNHLGATLNVYSPLTNNGTINNDGIIDAQNTITNNGTFNNNASGTVTSVNGLTNSGDFNSAGNTEIGTLSGGVTNTGTINVTGGTFTSNDTIDNSSGTIITSGTGSVSGTVSGNPVADTSTYYWVGGTSGSWNDSDCWSHTAGGTGGAGVPGADDTVWLSVNGITVTLSGDVTLKTLFVQNSVTVNLNGHDLTLSSGGHYTPDENAEFYAGAIHVGRDDVAGKLTLTGSGKLTAEIVDEEESTTNTVTLGADAEFYITGHIWTDSDTAALSTTVNGTGKLTFGSSAKLVFGGTGTSYFGFTVSSSVQLTDPNKLLLCRWTGATNTAWSNRGNWQLRHTPKTGEDVIILSGATRDPELTTTDSSTTVVLGHLTVETGRTFNYSQSVTITGFTGPGEITNKNTSASYKSFTVNSTEDVTIGTFNSYPGTQKADIVKNGASGKLILNGFMSNPDSVDLLLSGNIELNSSALLKNFYVSDGTVTLNVPVSTSEDLVVYATGGDLVCTAGSAPLTIGRNFENSYSLALNGNKVTFKGTNPVVTGEIDFGDVDASAATTLTFNDDVTFAGDFKGPSTTVTFNGNADFENATSFNCIADVYFFNKTAATKTFKTLKDSSFNNFYFWGNTEVVINGGISAVAFQMEKHGPDTNFVTASFTGRVSAGAATPKLTVTGSGSASGMSASRSSATANVYGTLELAVNTKAASLFTHSGTNTVFESGYTFDLENFTHYANSNDYKTTVTVKGTVNVSDTFDVNNSAGSTETTVAAGGHLNANLIDASSGTYGNPGSTIPFTNNGTVTVTTALDLVNYKVVNNGTVNVAADGMFIALTVSDSAGTGAAGIINFNAGAGNSGLSTGTTGLSIQKEINITGLNFTQQGNITVASRFSDTAGTGGNILKIAGNITVADGADLELKGSAGNLLAISSNASGYGFILTEDKTGGSYISVNTNTVIKEAAAGTAGTYSYTATNSVPAAGESDADFAAVYLNGWHFKDLKDLTYKWTGTSSREWANSLNWDLKIVPVAGSAVIIQDTAARWPLLTSANTGISLKDLTVGEAAGSTASITLANENVEVTGTLTNYGTIVYTNSGYITDGTSAVNDTANGGTVEYGTTGTAYSGKILSMAYAGFKVSGNTWETETDISADQVTVTGGVLTNTKTLDSATTVVLSGGKLDAGSGDGVIASSELNISGGSLCGTFKAAGINVTAAATVTDDIVLISDDVNIGAALNGTAYEFTVRPETLTKKINAGLDVASSFSLSGTEISNLKAKNLKIGTEECTGGIDILASLSAAGGLYLTTGGALTQSQTGAAIGTVSGELHLQASGGVGSITTDKPVAIGSVGGIVSAVNSISGDIYLSITSTARTILGGDDATLQTISNPAGNIKITTAGAIEIGGNISAAAGNLTLDSAKSIANEAGKTPSLTAGSGKTLELVSKNGIGSSSSYISTNAQIVSATASVSGGVFVSNTGDVSFTANAAAGAVSLITDSKMTLASAAVTCASQPVTLKAASFDFAANAVGGGTGTVTLTTPDSTDAGLVISQSQISGISTATERPLVIGDSAHTGNIEFDNAIDVSGFSSAKIISKKITSSSAVFTGSAVLEPVEDEMTLDGGFTFQNLSAENLGSKTLYFKNGTTTTVTGSLTLSGNSKTDRLNLRSDSDDSQWTINCTCAEENTSVSYVDVKDSSNTSAYDLVAGPAAAASSKDSGNNDNWSFPGQPYTWKGGATGKETVWAVKANWEENSVPSKGGYVTIPAGKTHYPVIEGTSVKNNELSLGTGTLTVEGSSLSVRASLDLVSYGLKASKITNNGIIRMEGNAGGNNVITVNGIDAATGTAGAALVNGTYSLIEYYGDCRAAAVTDGTLPWGKNYANLVFADGSDAALPETYGLTVAGTAGFVSGSGHSIDLAGSNRFTGKVSLGSATANGGDITLSGSNTFSYADGISIVSAENVVLNAAVSLKIADGASCTSLTVKSAATTGSVTTTGDQVYEKAVTLSGNSVFTCSAGNLVWFKNTVGGGTTDATTYSLTVKDGNARFDGNAGTAGRISTIQVDGTTTVTSSGTETVLYARSAAGMTFSGAFTAGTNVTFNGNGSCSFDSTVAGNSSADGRALTFNNLNVTFADDVGASDGVVSSVTVSNGTTYFSKASLQTVTTTGNQSYGKDIKYDSELVLNTDDSYSVTFGANAAGADNMTVNSKATAAGSDHIFDVRDDAAKSYCKVIFNKGFTDDAYVVIKGNAQIAGDNVFAGLKISNTDSDYDEETSVEFEADSKQTIKNALSDAVYFAGHKDYPLTITGGGTDESWKTVFVSKMKAENFSYVIIQNSMSVKADGVTANDLTIIPSVENVQDYDNSAFTTKYWFAYDYYWFGGTDTSWTTAGNWRYKKDGTVVALGYPDYKNGTSDIFVEDDATILTFGADTGDISINSLSVAKGKTVDFATYDLSLTKASKAIKNNGTIRLEGSDGAARQTISEGGVDAASGTVDALTNDADAADVSKVEYYGAVSAGILPLGYKYQNLEFTDGSSASVNNTHHITVAGTTLFASGEGNDVSLAGNNSFTGAVTLGDGTVQAGDVILEGSNTFGDAALITINKAETVILKGTGLVIENDAKPESLKVLSPVKLGSVTTTDLIPGEAEDTQYYAGAVTLSQDAVFTGAAGNTVHFGSSVACPAGSSFDFTVNVSDVVVDGTTDAANITAEGTAQFNGNVTAATVAVDGNTAFGAAGAQTVTTTGTQTYTGAVTIASNLSVTADDDVLFESTIDRSAAAAASYGAVSVTVNNGKSFTAEGFIGTTPLLGLTVSAATAEFNGFNLAGNASVTASDYAVLNTADYTSTGTQTFECGSGLRYVAGTKATAGEWRAVNASSGSDIILKDTDLFLDYGTNTVTLNADLSARNIYFYKGNLTVNSGKKVSAVNIAMWGAAYSADDPRYSGTDTRFAFFDYEDGLKAKDIYAASGFGAVLSASGAQLSVTGNFYDNGTDLDSVEIAVPDNSQSSPVFNSTGAVTEKQWGIPYATAFNCTVTDVTVTGGVLAAAEGKTQGCTKAGTNSGVQFSVPRIADAYTVYDDVIYVEFDMALENSKGEIATNLALFANGEVMKGGAWYSDSASATKYNFSAAYKDADCTQPVTEADSDIDRFYLRAMAKGDGSFETWNTDATGDLPYNAAGRAQYDSTDRAGNRKTTVPDISFMEGLFTAASGHTMSRNYGTNLEDDAAAGSYTAVADKTSPVLIAVYSGQELHDEYNAGTGVSSQKEYDAHNFIEFRYSEAVNAGALVSDAEDVNMRAEDSFDSAAAYGGEITAAGSGLKVAGYGTIEKGSLETILKSGTGSVNALYRSFKTNGASAAEAQTHRVRVSVAGYVDGTVTYTGNNSADVSGIFHNWTGCIVSAASPEGKITRAENEYITDLASNRLTVAATVNHPLPQLSVNSYADSLAADTLYSGWDVLPPVIAPFVTEKEEWANWGAGSDTEYAEIVGSSESNVTPTLENIEVHILDNNRKQVASWTPWWRTKMGWNDLPSGAAPSMPETAGGARPFATDSGATAGGIRRSSLDGANAAFTYKSIVDSVTSSEKDIDPSVNIAQKVYSNIFRGSSDPDSLNDGLYLRLPLAETTLPVRTTFELYYNPASSYITDLAGNLLSSSYAEKTAFSSIDLTPPAFTMTLAPVGQNKVYVIFTKRLSYGQTYFSNLSDAMMNTALTEIRDSFNVIAAGAGAGAAEEIAISKVEYVSSSSEYTSFMFTLAKNLDLSNIENLWLRDIGHGTDMVQDASGFLVNDTKIRDYIGNYLAVNKGHAISDFAVNAADVLYAYSNEKDGDDWNEQGIYGEDISAKGSDYAVHDFTKDQGNYGKLTSGRDITLQVRTVAGVDSAGKETAPVDRNFVIMPSKTTVLNSQMISDKINKLTGSDWRLWLPTELTSLATQSNSHCLASPADPVSADSGAGFLWNYIFPESDYGFKGGDEIQFVFKVQDNTGTDITIDHDADNWGSEVSPTDRVPLYAVKMPESQLKAGDFSFIDLWSFGIKDLKQQRGGVTILNNVINVNVKEQTVVEVNMEEEGSLNVFVMTLDGNIIKRLAHGRTSAGTHYYRWNGTNNAGNAVARGMYFIRVSGPGIDETRKVMCVKE